MKKLYLLVTLLVLAVLPVHAKDIRIENLSSAAFQKKFDDFLQQGFRLVKVSCVTLPGAPGEEEKVGFGGLFRQVKNSPAWQARHGLTAEGYQKVFDELVAQGYMPTDIATCYANEQVLYSVIYDQIPDAKQWYALHNISAEQFEKADKHLAAKGLKLKLKVTCETGTGPVSAAVWQKE